MCIANDILTVYKLFFIFCTGVLEKNIDTVYIK